MDWKEPLENVEIPFCLRQLVVKRRQKERKKGRGKMGEKEDRTNESNREIERRKNKYHQGERQQAR
jgi:hypothetical protein